MAGFEPGPFLASLAARPGVYQMYDAGGAILYIGKAKNLKKRVASYFRASGLSARSMALVARIADIQVTVTASETDALLLEHNLIKRHRPPYNILLRDDKSYPYIYMSGGEKYPRLALHRGAKRAAGEYFGPFPSAGAVRESLHLMQKVFQVRQCEDSYFRNRSRPCLQYQIGRCTGPCAGKVSESDYARQVEDTRLFLRGKSAELMARLADEMETAAAGLEFERAAGLRDRLAHLQHVQARQSVEGVAGDIDIVSAAVEAGRSCVQMLFVRAGRVLGSRSHFPPARLGESPAEVIGAFLPQFYLARGREIPAEIILAARPEGADSLAAVLGARAGRKVEVKTRVRDPRARWLRLAAETASQNLQSHLAARQTGLERALALQRALELEAMPRRMECFDISHSSGEAPLASCVVFDAQGPRKSEYRKFNIEKTRPGDDYAALRQALERRYRRLKGGEGAMPDLLFVDGGRGQVSQAMSVLAELEISAVEVVGIAKGATRKAGCETLIRGDGGGELRLPGDSQALHLIQHIRDEAHRFAVAGHRGRRDRRRRGSALERIRGVGAKRRRNLLRHFGGLPGIQRASVEELMKVAGINEKIAREIYDCLHSN